MKVVQESARLRSFAQKALDDCQADDRRRIPLLCYLRVRQPAFHPLTGAHLFKEWQHMCGNFFSRFDSRCVVVQFPPSVSTIDQFTDSDAHRARWLHDMIRWIATPKSSMNVRIKHSS